MQHFDTLEHYTEEDFDYILYQPSSKKPYLDHELKQFYFVYEDEWGEEYELFTTVECLWKVVRPDPSSWDSPEDYYGYTELKSWEVISVEDHEGNEVKPEDVLTEKQLLAYTQDLEEFVES
jgi:hypothetical protein